MWKVKRPRRWMGFEINRGIHPEFASTRILFSREERERESEGKKKDEQIPPGHAVNEAWKWTFISCCTLATVSISSCIIRDRQPSRISPHYLSPAIDLGIRIGEIFTGSLLYVTPIFRREIARGCDRYIESIYIKLGREIVSRCYVYVCG